MSSSSASRNGFSSSTDREDAGPSIIWREPLLRADFFRVTDVELIQGLFGGQVDEDAAFTDFDGEGRNAIARIIQSFAGFEREGFFMHRADDFGQAVDIAKQSAR